MFTSKDIEFRSVYVINCLKDRELRVSSGELLLEDMESHQTLTKLPFQKILALFVVGHITGADSVLIFDAPNAKVQKFGNAIHRDADVVYL